MIQLQDIERLQRRVHQERLEPITTIVSLLTRSFGGLVTAMLHQVRQTAMTQPLTTLIFALQAGFLIARFGRHHAQR